MMAASGQKIFVSDLDVHSELSRDDEELKRIAEANELFDAALTGAVDKTPTISMSSSDDKETKAEEKEQPEDVTTSKKKRRKKKLSLYIGHFPWWTSDKDLMTMAQRLGVKDIINIIFAENPVNGQSKGYAQVVVTSEESWQLLLTKIPQCEVNGERLNCLRANSHTFKVFEDIANKRIPSLGNSKSPEELQPLLFHPMPPNVSNPTPPYVFPPHPAHLSSQPSSSLHVNPAFITPQDGHSSKAYSQQNHTLQEELIKRNQAAASSAIANAYLAGASDEEQQMARGHLRAAIAIIKESQVYGDERCQALVTSLNDCLMFLKRKYFHSTNDEVRHRDRGRNRDREHDRGHSSDWEEQCSSQRRRERSWSDERVKECSRERDRHRDHRDHREQHR